MTPHLCPHEPALLEALETGTLPSGLQAHLAACLSCRETHAVAALLRSHAASLAAARHLPPAPARVWRAAQARRKTLALRRVTRLMTAMATLAALYLVALVTWCLHTLWQTRPNQAPLTLSLLSTGTVTAGIAAAAFLVLAGAATLIVLAQRRPIPLLR